MNLIELHILQSFPVTCLNRDDLGAPKTAWFGGCQRARVSSQSWKRSIRSLAREQASDLFAGQRTRYLLRLLKDAYIEKGLDTDVAHKLAATTADSLGKLDSLEKGNVKTLLFFSPQELGNVVDAVLKTEYDSIVQLLINEVDMAKKKKEDTEKKLKKMTDKAVKAMKKKVKDNADIAIFGRMVADDHSLMVEGAGLFSHALSTHSVSNEIDFFSAVDDNNAVGDEGAGHIGTLEYNSACYYRYVGLNLDLLNDQDHLEHYSTEERKEVLSSFLRASLMAVPSARKNSMFGFNPPAYVLGLQRNGQPLSLVNAFETPVRSSRGYIQESSDLMTKHWKSLKKTYCLENNVKVSTSMPENNLEEFIQTLLKD